MSEKGTGITKFALSSITKTAGSVFLSTRRFEINRITAPKEKMHIRASFVLKRLLFFSEVDY